MTAEKGDLSDVVAVVGGNLGNDVFDGDRTHGFVFIFIFRIVGRYVLRESFRVGCGQAGEAIQQSVEALCDSRPLFGVEGRGLRPTFNGVSRIRWRRTGDASKLVFHPVIHVLDDLPDGVGIVGNGLIREIGGNIFEACDGADMSALAVDKFAEGEVGHGKGTRPESRHQHEEFRRLVFGHAGRHDGEVL